MIPFSKPHILGSEIEYISMTIKDGALSGDKLFTKKCHEWLETNLQVKKALLTHSCTAALEMSAILADLAPGDEVIMPSYTFVSTANAFVLRGATPVFVDIRLDTQNIDETKIESAITNKTKAIVVVHYAGVACEMDTIMQLAQKHNLLVIEDAAQAIGSKYKGKALGSIGDFGCLSFHETKNIVSGEGGALLINNETFLERSEIIREKGTNRSRFFRGEVDKYTWCDIGSSYLPSELIAAFLYAQLEKSESINNERLLLWNQYHEGFEELERKGFLKRPVIPSSCEHNAHMYYVILNDVESRTKLIGHLKESKISSVFHYIPLHSSPAGIKYGRVHGDMKNTDKAGDCLLRFPMWNGLEVDKVLSKIKSF